jgi:hypothetical protein
VSEPATRLAESKGSFHLAALVVCDASWRSGHAGLAVTGEIGPIARYEKAASSTLAEFAAMLWAMKMAAGMPVATFATDCSAVARWWHGSCDPSHGAEPKARARISEQLRIHQRWQVVLVPNRVTVDADRLAFKVREENEPVRPVRRSVKVAKPARLTIATSRGERVAERDSPQPPAPRRQKAVEWGRAW